MVCEKDLMTVERDGREVEVDLGFVGRPVEMNPEVLAGFLGSDFIPVVAPIGTGRRGETYNVNGDTAAGAIAAAMKADRLMLLTDVAGVKDADGAVLTQLSAADVRELTAAGVISGGMIPKTQTALDAIAGGVRAVVILDGRAPHAVLLELFTAHGAGTPDPRLSWPGARGVAARGAAAGPRACSARFHPGPEDGAPDGCGTLVLLGPDGPGFWDAFRASPEYRDGGADPLDRWSERVIGGAGGGLGARGAVSVRRAAVAAVHRLGAGSGEAWASPVGLLVHARRGLMVSYRGALALAERLALPPPAARPCDACAAALPRRLPGRGARRGAGYDLAACHGWLDTAPGRDCLTRGCAVRRACPVGRGLQPEAQSAFHMAAFHGRQRACDG